MHLLVPGAYRLKGGSCSRITRKSQCTFWCRVLTDLDVYRPRLLRRVSMHLLVPGAYRPPTFGLPSLGLAVSMHLLVPGAYRLSILFGLFVAFIVSMHLLVPGAYRPDRRTRPNRRRPGRLNAPSGAGCLPTSGQNFPSSRLRLVSMHLLVPGAYRRICSLGLGASRGSLNAPSGAGCLPTGITVS